MNTRQKLRRLVKEGCDINSAIEEQEYVPLLNKIVEIAKSNAEINPDFNNALVLKTGISRVSNATFLNILETKKNLVFNDIELAESLLASVQDEDEENSNWLKLCDRAMGCFKTVFLPYPIQISHEQRNDTQKVKTKRAKRSTQVAPASVAEKLSRFDGENARALESVYNDVIRSFVEGGKVPMPFFKLICDPTSFPKSVSNAFQLSFLIQSNLLKVFKNDAGETHITPIDMNAPFTSQKGGDNRVHAITTLDYDLWEQTVSNYQIETSMICG